MISIITPVYNAEKFIAKCIEALQKQTVKDFEIILVNDGSKDGSGALCDAFARADSRIKVIHQENQGPGPSRNAGVQIATGEYILFVDSDDYLTENALEVLEQTLSQQNDPDAVLFDYTMGTEENQLSRSTVPGFSEGPISQTDAILCSTGATWCKLYKAELIKKYGVEFPALQRKEDFVFNKLALSHCSEIYYRKAPLYFYYVNPESVMNTTVFSEEVQRKAFETLYQKISPEYKGLVDLLTIRDYLISAVQSRLTNGAKRSEICAFLQGYVNKVPDWYAKSKKLNLPMERRLCLYWIEKKRLLCLRLFFAAKKTAKRLLMKV